MTTTINASTSAGLVQTADTSGSLALQTAGTTAITIDTSQNVGINTTSLGGKFSITDNTGGAGLGNTVTLTNGVDANCYIKISGSSATDKQAQIGPSTGTALAFQTNATERMRINSSGNVGIGVTSPSPWSLGKGLEVGFAGGGINGTRQAETNFNCNLYYDGSWRYGGTGKGSFIQLSDGTAYIYTVTASGTAGASASLTTGPYVANGGTSWTSSSDERLKNITGQIENALDKVNQLRAAKFTWKSDTSNKPQIGLIAQDVQKVLPEVVNSSAYVMDDETEYLGLQYTDVIPLLVASIKELKAINDTLSARIVALENR
jgi:hypothetical protein